MNHYIGMDVGGTKLAAAALRDGGLCDHIVRPTHTGSAGALLDDVVAVVETLRTEETAAIGIGVPSVVEFATGRIRYSLNIPLVDLPLRESLTERIGLPVYIENDANCAALAEASDGETIACRDLAMITVGTGIGGGLVLNGQLYRGATGAAAELGHMIIAMPDVDAGDAADPGTLTARSLEHLAAGTELDRLARRTAVIWQTSALGTALSTRGVVTGHDAVIAARAGDDHAIAILRTLGTRLGVGIANLINLFDPREVVIGGGVSTAGNLLLDPARETARRFVFRGVGTECVIRLARTGVTAGTLGAALLAKTEHTRLAAMHPMRAPARSR